MLADNVTKDKFCRYDSMSFDIGLSKPDMRSATENELKLIAQGLKSRGQVRNGDICFLYSY